MAVCENRQAAICHLPSTQTDGRQVRPVFKAPGLHFPDNSPTELPAAGIWGKRLNHAPLPSSLSPEDAEH